MTSAARSRCSDGFVEAACSTASSKRAAARARRRRPTARRCVRRRTVIDRDRRRKPSARAPGPTQCHDITVYPAIGLAGGACEGYGFLLDIKNPAQPVRLDAVADSNFSYWHSATFNNDGTKVLFSDEWGGGGAPKCRATDKKEWGADAIFTIENRQAASSRATTSCPRRRRTRKTASRITVR